MRRSRRRRKRRTFGHLHQRTATAARRLSTACKSSHMSSSTHSGGAVKRQRELQQEDTKGGPASVQVTAPPASMMLLALVESYRGIIAWLQLCNPQYVFKHSFVCLPPRLSRPFAGSPMYVMSLIHSERLRAVGCGLYKYIYIESVFFANRLSEKIHAIVRLLVWRHQLQALQKVLQDGHYWIQPHNT